MSIGCEAAKASEKSSLFVVVESEWDEAQDKPPSGGNAMGKTKSLCAYYGHRDFRFLQVEFLRVSLDLVFPPR